MFLQVNKKPPIVVGGFFMVSAKTDNRADSRRNSCNFSELKQISFIYFHCTASVSFFLIHLYANRQITTETREPQSVASPIGNSVVGNITDIR